MAPSTVQIQAFEEPKLKAPLLDQRFAALKKSLVKSEHKQKVVESYDRLCKILETEADFIAKHGPAMVPEIDFREVQKNGGTLPPVFADLVREQGCLILRNVVPEEQAVAWERELLDYISRHRTVGGSPPANPQNWSLWWTRPQVQIRSHPEVLKAMKCVNKLWHVFGSYYAGGPGQSAFFEGRWQDWDAWVADSRIDAKSDLYEAGNSCSCWRSLQGWLSLSYSNTGEGTLRLLPSLKASIAYMMLRPLFLNGEFDDTQPIFPESTPGRTQFKPSDDWHPHLMMEKSMIGHLQYDPGTTLSGIVISSMSPLTAYNIDSLLAVRSAFEKATVPKDFIGAPNIHEKEFEHEDHGARRKNILSEDGMRAMGFQEFDIDEEGITEGQKVIRRLANVELGLA